jgi:hypothetical protein
MMKNLVVVTLYFLVLSFTLGLAQNPGDQVFSKPHIFEVRFHFDQTDYLDSLHNSHESGNYISGDVTVDGVLYNNVGVRFKGHSSYLFYPGEKKPLRIKFNEFTDHLFDGMKKINLNNGWGDPTMLREKLHLDYLKEQDVPAPRANFARVYIDSVYWGFYSLVEHVDKVFLKTRFGDNDGNLYKAEKSTLEWQGSDQEIYYDDLELKTNERENNWSDLIHFLDILNNTPESEFYEQLGTIFNPDHYLKAWAADNLFVNFDSYLGSATNYYLYNNPQTSKFEWIVWDVNLSLAARTGFPDFDILYAIPQRPLMDRILSVDNYKDRYLLIMKDYAENYFTVDHIFPQIDQLANLIREDYLTDPQKMYQEEEIIAAIDQKINGVPGLKPFILERRESVLMQLDSLANVSDITNQEIVIQSKTLRLNQNYPNPFNPTTIINYELQIANDVELSIYNLIGQKIAILISEKQNAGIYRVKWNAANLPSGVYYALLQAGDSQVVKKMILAK